MKAHVGVLVAGAVMLGLGAASSQSPGPTGTLVIAQTQDPHSWDPIDTFLLSWGMVGSNIFDGLVDRGPDLKIKPGLAERWVFLQNNAVIRFTLRRGVKFQNGEDFDANAVKFTFDRLLGPEGAKGPQQANYTAIKEVKIVSKYVVDFIMDRPDPVIITKLAGYGAKIVPPKYLSEVGDEKFNNLPVGTGPFRPTEYVKDDHLTLEAFPGYWGGAPKVKTVTYRFIPEAATRVAELQAGRADIVQGVPVSLASVVKGISDAQLVPVGTTTVTELRFNTSIKPMDDVRVRKAMIYAVDRDTIIKTILQGYGKPIASFQGEISWGFDPNLKPLPYDPEKAKALLTEAKVPAGTEIEIDFADSDAQFREVAQGIAGYLQAVGLKVNLKTFEQNTYFSDIIPKNKTGQMYNFGWGGWTLDFDNTAYLLYHKGEYWNPVFSDPKVEALLDKERGTYKQDVRQKTMQELARYLQDIAIELPLYQGVNLWGMSKRVSGWVVPPDDRNRLVGVAVK
jgi:peptide/nickel transport system substrate-binding protein